MARRHLAGLALALFACEGPPEAALDGGADAPLGPCTAPSPAPETEDAGAPDPAARGEIAWQYRDPALSFLAAQPAIGPDGTVYASGSVRLFALSPEDGSVKWMAASGEGESLLPTPLVDPAGRIWMSSVALAVYVFGPDGAVQQHIQLAAPDQSIGGAPTAPARTPDGIAVGVGGRIYWLDDCGQVLAAYDHSARLSGDLVAASNGTVVTGEPSGNALVAIAPTARLRWRTVLDGAPGGLALAGTEVVVTTGTGGSVAVLDLASGHLRAERHLDPRVGAPIVLADGTIVVAASTGAATGRLHGLAPGDLGDRFTVDLPGQPTLLPVATHAGVLLGVSDGTTSRLLLVDGGTVRFATDCSGCSFVGESPAVGKDGTAYLSALTRILALRTPAALDEGAPWPRARGADNRNQARPVSKP